MFEIHFGNHRAKKEYVELDEKTRARINELCEILSKVPVPFREYDIKKVGGRECIYRVRLGTFRILYLVEEVDHIIYILSIEQRSETTYK